MAEIRDCAGKKVKISKHSITIKNDDGKTCGVVRDITSIKDMQFNMQFEYYGKLKKIALKEKISLKGINIKDCIVKDGILYAFRDMEYEMFLDKFRQKYGCFPDENDEKKRKERDLQYKKLKELGIDVIECIFV